MYTLLALIDPLFALATGGADFILAKGSDGFVRTIRNFVGPLFLLACGIAAMSFLFQRQITQFLQFFVLAIAIAAFFYAPGFVEELGRFLAKAF